MQRIDELREPPVVGRFYLVPTVRYVYRRVLADWPVIGPKHEDAKHFNFPWQHYHVDPRFVCPSLGRRVLIEGLANFDTLEKVTGHSPLAQYGEPIETTVEPHPAPVWRRRRCRASKIVYQFGDRGPIKKLRAEYADKPLIKTPCGRVCPHRGASVDTLAPDKRGIITCPLHGLRFHYDTGMPAL